MKYKKTAKSFLALFLAAAVVFVSYYGFLSLSKTLYPLRYEKFVKFYTEKYNLEKSFVYAVIKNESNFDPNAVSSADAKGLMQILPETFRWLQSKTKEVLDEDKLFDPETSIKYGCMLYNILFKMFGDKETVVAAYHAGLGNVSKWLKNKEYSSDGIHLEKIPFASTDSYVKKVVKTENIYNRLYKL